MDGLAVLAMLVIVGWGARYLWTSIAGNIRVEDEEERARRRLEALAEQIRMQGQAEARTEAHQRALDEAHAKRQLEAREVEQREIERKTAAKRLAETQYSEAIERPVTDLFTRRSTMIDRFREKATRHVSRPDDYGMEQWRDLPKLIHECISRLAEAEGFTVTLSRPRQFRDGQVQWSTAIEVAVPRLVELMKRTGAYSESMSWRIAGNPARHSRVELQLSCDFYSAIFNRLESIVRESLQGRQIEGPSTGRNIAEMSGEDFEREIRSRLEKLGCQCEMTPTTGDQGADLIISFKGRRIAVQCKRQASAVGNSSVQEVTAAKRFYKCDEAWVVTNSRFTKSALELARANEVTLIEGTELDRLHANLLEASRPPVNGRLFD